MFDLPENVVGLLLTGVVAGVLGTVAMDALNALVARTGAIAKIDVPAIGRMAAGWARGRFRYGHPGEMTPAAHETPSSGSGASPVVTREGTGTMIWSWPPVRAMIPAPRSRERRASGERSDGVDTSASVSWGFTATHPSREGCPRTPGQPRAPV